MLLLVLWSYRQCRIWLTEVNIKRMYPAYFKVWVALKTAILNCYVCQVKESRYRRPFYPDTTLFEIRISRKIREWLFWDCTYQRSPCLSIKCVCDPHFAHDYEYTSSNPYTSVKIVISKIALDYYTIHTLSKQFTLITFHDGVNMWFISPRQLVTYHVCW